MPDVRMPDGTIIRNVPEGTTKAQLMARLHKARPTPKRGGILGAVDHFFSTANEAAIGAVQGLENIGAAVTDPIASMIVGDEPVKQAQQARQNRWDKIAKATVTRPNPTARTIGQVGGAMALPVPKVPFLGKIGNRALQGGLGGAAVRDSDQSAAPGAAAGAISNVVLPPLLSKLAQSKPAQAVGRAASRAMGMAPRPLSQPLAPLGRKAQARAARFKALGIEKPTTGMVTRDPAAFSFEQNAARVQGSGDDLARQLREVETGLVEKGRALVRNLGGAKGPEATGKAVEEVLDAKRAEMQQVTGRLYDKVRETRGNEPVGDLAGFRDLLDDPMLTDNPVFDGMREGVKRRLERLGIAANTKPGKLTEFMKEGNEHFLLYTTPSGREVSIQLIKKGDGTAEISIDPFSKAANSLGPGELRRAASQLQRKFPDLKMIFGDRQTGAGVGRKQTAIMERLLHNEGDVTVGQAEELRKFVGGLGSGIEPSVRMMRSKMIDALDDDVVNAVGDDAFKAARASARARFQEFSKTFPGRLADEKVAPEVLTRRILGDGVKLSDLRALKRSLVTGTDEQVARGEGVWRDLQAQSVDELLRKAVDDDGNLRGAVLSREFTKSAPKFRELLGPEDFKTLRRLSAATRDVKAYPAGHSVNTSNTAATLANMFDNAPERVKDGWLKLFGKIGIRAGAHAAAAPVGPLGNVAVEGVRAAGAAAAAHKAESAAAQALVDKIRLAQNPEAAAAAIREAQAAAASSPVVADILEKAGLGRLLGTGGRALGGTAAATQ